VITRTYVQRILDRSEFTYSTQFDKCTIVACKLPNGFIIVESASCIDPMDYDEELGKEICLQKIGDKVAELEGYAAHTLNEQAAVNNEPDPEEINEMLKTIKYWDDTNN
jgi:hypothetical protein